MDVLELRKRRSDNPLSSLSAAETCSAATSMTLSAKYLNQWTDFNETQSIQQVFIKNSLLLETNISQLIDGIKEMPVLPLGQLLGRVLMYLH